MQGTIRRECIKYRAARIIPLLLYLDAQFTTNNAVYKCKLVSYILAAYLFINSQDHRLLRSFEIVKSAPPNPSITAFAERNSARAVRLKQTRTN